MKQSEFRAALALTFGDVLGPSYAQDVHLPGFGATAAQALEAGAEPLEVWHALCDALERPDAKWAHRGMARK
ncbi:DUF3046 domain-containing protein [Buchananella felis]|uniref:DUF3046 domain-containing protein n=1 Tax=Buchananella felis TaxID=3231492 RepID=UPI00352763CE